MSYISGGTIGAFASLTIRIEISSFTKSAIGDGGKELPGL